MTTIKATRAATATGIFTCTKTGPTILGAVRHRGERIVVGAEHADLILDRSGRSVIDALLESGVLVPGEPSDELREEVEARSARNLASLRRFLNLQRSTIPLDDRVAQWQKANPGRLSQDLPASYFGGPWHSSVQKLG